MKNLGNMMKAAQKMQEKMEALQAELEKAEVEGQAGGGMVTVRLNGKGEMRGLKLDKTLVDPEDIEVLEDLIVAAHNDAKAKADAKMQEGMKEMAGGMPLPPGMKLPF